MFFRKIFYYFICLKLLSSCNLFSNPYAIPYNTEIICIPYGPSILVKFITARQLKSSAIKYHISNRNSQNKTNFTILYLNDGRSLTVKIPPEEIIDCEFRQSRIGEVEERYIHKFY